MTLPSIPLPTATLPEVDYDFTVDTREGVASWEVVQFTLRESLNAPFEAVLVLASPSPDNDPAELLERRAAFSLQRADLARTFHGVVRSVEDLGRGPEHRFACVSLAPPLWLLSQRHDCRIFQDLDAVAVVRAVLRDAGLALSAEAMRVAPSLAQLPTREYRVQYRESDLDFVARVLEDDGVTWYLERGDGAEVLVLTEHLAGCAPVTTLDRGAVPRGAGEASQHPVETVRWFDRQRQMRPTGVALRDFDFTRPEPALFTTAAHPANPGARAAYDHPGDFVLAGYDRRGDALYAGHDGARRARMRHEEQAAPGAVARGASNVTGFSPGLRVALEALAGDAPAEHVLTRVEHRGHAWGALVDSLEHDERFAELAREHGFEPPTAPRYANRFECVASDAAYRPARATRRPVIQGPQTAIVARLPGSADEICTDPHGRVLVRFHWDRREPDAPAPSTAREAVSSCWVRVSQTWAGGEWGFSFVPRVGMEVVVQFLEGDPDRPLVVGCVYNGQNRPPYALPASRTRSTVRTRSSPGGVGYNELSFEDLAGGEEVYLRAQRDLREEVLRDHTTRVDVDRALQVGRDRTVIIRARDSLLVGADRSSTIRRDDALTVEGDLTVEVHGPRGERHTLDEDWSVQADGGCAVVARRELTLECGTSRIVMTPDRIRFEAENIDLRATRDANIDGGMVNINCDDADVDAPTRRAALREQMLRVGMPSMLEGVEQHPAADGLDARKLWNRTARALQDLVADQPELFQDRLMLRAGGAFLSAMNGALAAREAPPEQGAPATVRAAETVDRAFADSQATPRLCGSPDGMRLLDEGRRHASRASREASGFVSSFHRGMSADPAWQALAAEQGDEVRRVLDRQARALLRERTVQWSLAHEGVAFEPSVTSTMRSAARNGTRSMLDAVFSPSPAG